MFSPDVVNLRQFYTSPMGEEVCRLIAESLRKLWPESKGDTVLGIGFPTPYLEPFLKDGTAFACMPAQQGAAYWPAGQNNRVLLAHESQLPFPENSINRVLLIHSIETSEELSGMMREVWRVLTPGGRVLAIVPNRLGFWSRSANSPFGYGRPFSMAQLRALLGEQQFTFTRSSCALFIPPVRLKILWRAANYIELFGKYLCRFIGGVWLIEAEKQLYAAIKQPIIARAYRTAPVTQPALSLKRD